jgi:hypothetical protein
MHRAQVLSIGVIVCALAHSGNAHAQTATTPDGWVVLGVDEYRALRERAAPPPTRPQAPPVDATLTRIDYELRVEGDTVAGRALLTIDALRDGWTRVEIPAGLMARDARLDGQPVAMRSGDRPAILIARSGRSVVTLDISLPLATAAGGESIHLPASAASISRATLTLPRTGIDVTVAGGFLAERAETPAETRWMAFAQAGQSLTLSWKRRVDDRRAELPLRTRARVTTVVGLGEDVSQVSSAVRVEVVQGLARELTVAVPDGLTVNQVEGATVADWSVTGGLLRVRLLDPTSTEASFVVTGETRAPREGAVVVPLVRMPSAERETGGVAVDVVGAGEISGRQARGLEPADPSELGDPVTGRESPSMIAFRMRPLTGAEPRALSVTVVRYTPQAVLIANVEEARYRALAAEDGRLLVEARYAVRNNQRSFLKVSLPPGASLWTAQVAGRPIRPGVAEGSAVLLPLEKGRAGEEAPTFVLQLIYLQRTSDWAGKGIAALQLPALDLPISRSGLTVHYSPRYKLDVRPGSFRLEDDIGPFAEALRALPPAAALPPGALAAEARSARRANAGASAGLQELVDRFQNDTGARRVTGALPVTVTFPEFGHSLFLASELIAEGSAPSVDLAFRRVK